jgi:hypothetical protein
MKTEMTQEEKINYMRISSGICGFSIQNKHLDLLVSLYELVCKKEGSAKIDDIVAVELEVKKRDDIKSRQELLDKVSEKKE